SPEQSRGDEITTATDVYSLGVVLYRLLAGTAPYDVERKTPSEVRAILSDQVPALPSAVATDEHALARGLSNAAALRRALTGELDAIVMMSLRKEPERRYASVEALSDDILRYLKGLPVVARPDTLGYRVRSFVRRQRALVAGGGIAVLALVAGTVVSVRQAQVARDQARRATRVTQYLQAIVGGADPSHYSALRSGRKDVGLMEVLDSTRSRVSRDLANEPRIRADLYWSMANGFRVFGRHDIALMLFDSARILHATSVGERTIEVARDLLFTGYVLQDLARYDEAIARFRDARARYDGLRAPPDSEVTAVLFSLGQVLGVATNQFVEGERLLREAEGRELASRSPRPAMTGLIQGALGATLMQVGSYAAADSAYGRAVASYNQDSVRARFERAYALVNWGTLLSRQGRFDEAARIKRRALVDMVIALGNDDISTARVQLRLADDLLHLGRLGEARGLADSSVAELARLVTSHPLDWTMALRVRGAVARHEGRLEEAERTLDRSATYLAQLSGGGRVGPEVALLTEYGHLYEARGKRARAAASFQKAYDIALAGVGASNAVTLAALGRLAAFASRTGDVARADSLLADSVRAATTVTSAKR
ncbi:MAG: tetratricopeptide repeat protein, partial [Gemmatimonadaceae bacterium]